MERFNEMQQWVLARREIGPIGRHALYVLESTDALDMTVDTFFSALLHGEASVLRRGRLASFVEAQLSVDGKPVGYGLFSFRG